MTRKLNRHNRIFFIEPNLIRGMGHVIEFPISLSNYFKKSNNIFYLANKNVYSNVRSKIKGLIGRISKTCFQELDSKGRYFYSDLSELDKKYNFSNLDLIVVLTSYWNEIKGANTYLHNKKINCPKIVLWTHQIYSPHENFKSTLDNNFIEQAKLGWKDALNNIHPQISLACTPSKEMKKYFDSISSTSMSFLPLPYECVKPNKSNRKNNINIAFLGDGRYEKGLIIFLKAISDMNNALKFNIQNIYPRGFEIKEKDYFNSLVEKLIQLKNVKFHNKPQFPDKFVKFIAKQDIIVLPYHPLSYDMRVSGVFIQAIQHGIPCVVSSGTWMAKEILNNKSGTIFEYDINKDFKYNSISLKNTIMETVNNIGVIKNETSAKMVIYRDIYSAKNFMKTLFKIIN